VVAVFFLHGLLFASWTAHIPQVKDHLGLSDGSLGLALLGAPLGSVVAMVVAGRLLPTLGSRVVVRGALIGYCVSGPLIGLTGSAASFFVAFLLWGFFQGALDASMNTQAISVERSSARVLMPGFHGAWSIGALAGALTGALAVGLGVTLSMQLLILGVPGVIVVGWLTTRMIPDRRSPPAPGSPRPGPPAVGAGIFQKAIVVLGAIAFADMLCEGAAADWAAVYLRGLAMVTVRLLGNRLLTRFARYRLVPALAGTAAAAFATCLVVDRPASILVGFAFLGAGLGCVVPTVLSAAGDVSGVHAGRAVATVAGCGWAGFVVGPVVVGGIASASSLHVALFVIPTLTLVVALATGLTAALRGGRRPSATLGE
jgi:MFS family permease